MLTVTSSGGFDDASSTMTYHYNSSDETGPAQKSSCSVGSIIDPQSAQSTVNLLPKCSDYYIKGLYRQHTMPALFRDFSSQLGRAYLVNSPGYYAVCVSAGASDARSVAQDGVMTLRYVRKDVKNTRGCPVSFPVQSSNNFNGTTMPTTTSQQSSFPNSSWIGASTTAPSHLTPTVWSTAQLSVARYFVAATSVGNVAFFAGGQGGNCSFCVV